MVFRVANLIRLNKMVSFIFRGLFRKNKEKRDSFLILSLLSNIRFLIIFLLQNKQFFSEFRFQQGLCPNGPVESLVGGLSWYIIFQVLAVNRITNNVF